MYNINFLDNKLQLNGKIKQLLKINLLFFYLRNKIFYPTKLFDNSSNFIVNYRLRLRRKFY